MIAALLTALLGLVFRYDPPSFRLGLAISGGALAVALALALAARTRTRAADAGRRAGAR